VLKKGRGANERRASASERDVGGSGRAGHIGPDSDGHTAGSGASEAEEPGRRLL
jgi:hypothetical protein